MMPETRFDAETWLRLALEADATKRRYQEAGYYNTASYYERRSDAALSRAAAIEALHAT